VEVRARVGDQVELGDGCVVGVRCILTRSGVVPSKTVVHGEECRWREANETPLLQTSQLDFLRKALPNYHLLANKKSNRE